MTPGILLLYYLPLDLTAPTIVEHIEVFGTYSAHPVWAVNTAAGFPPGLAGLRFNVVVLHYSLFGPPAILGTWPSGLSHRFHEYLRQSSGTYKIAFFQDEHHYCQARFEFLRQHAVDCVFTLLHPRYWDDVYRKYTHVGRLEYTLTGYVSDDLVARAQALTRPDAERTIDIGYRARRLPFYMGRGAQEKADIGDEFVRRTAGRPLRLDIDVEERSRIYGDAWWEFLANCRGALGVEAGVSIFDLNDEARLACTELLRRQPGLTFEQAHAQLLHRWDGNITYRTISPRHLEAAALRVCQILFEGDYQDILKADVHYIPLKKDFSNLDEVLERFGDPATRARMTGRAYDDLIASGSLTYAKFIADFDRVLADVGITPPPPGYDREVVSRRLNKGKAWLDIRRRLVAIRHVNFPGRRQLAAAARRVLPPG